MNDPDFSEAWNFAEDAWAAADAKRPSAVTLADLIGKAYSNAAAGPGEHPGEPGTLAYADNLRHAAFIAVDWARKMERARLEANLLRTLFG